MEYPDNLWPQVPVSTSFREKAKKILEENGFPHTTNILARSGSLGDYVQITPVARALKIKYPERPNVVVIRRPPVSLFDEHPYVDHAIEGRKLGRLEMLKSVLGLTENVIDLRFTGRIYGTWPNTQFSAEHALYYDSYPKSGRSLEILNMHACDILLLSLGLDGLADCNDVYIKPEKAAEQIEGDYVVVCGTPGFRVERLKRWTEEGWNGLISWMRSNGIMPVQLGLANNPLLHPAVIDMRGKTTARQAAYYLGMSRGYVGIEGGLFHLSKAVGAPAVVIFNSTSDVCFAYPGNRVVTKRICRPCMWEQSWKQARCLYGHQTCLNNPDWRSVSVEVTKMLETPPPARSKKHPGKKREGKSEKD